MSIRHLDQVLESQTYANDIFLDLILSQGDIWKVQYVNIATLLYILEHPDFVEC